MMRKLLWGIFILLVIIILILIWVFETKEHAYSLPEYEKVSLDLLYEEENYQEVSLQTGLSIDLVEELIEEEGYDTLEKMQEQYFHMPEIKSNKVGLFLWMEEIVLSEDEKKQERLVGLEEGDLLVSYNTHMLGWRNGHIAIVVDATKGEVLEAIALGENSVVRSIDYFEQFPAISVYRLKNTSKEVRKEIAEFAVSCYEGIPYGLTEDILEEFTDNTSMENTHCAHLIWKCFMSYGYDLDSNGGMIVTPKDIAKSTLLELRQSIGM